ncbi:hypothetical protein KAMFAM_224 [Bacillus phage Kamfam]|nr:hypothetical protein OTK52_222 [Bacillus phage OTooleKemple52]AXQ67120.1 hypothetical protein KAMFAM_224 [Bacillus phage Kamfam]
MSYIEEQLKGKEEPVIGVGITDFLLEEGFKVGSGAQGEGHMYYVASNGGLYDAWLAVGEDFISVYVEYNCGGHIDDANFDYWSGDLESFKNAYVEAVDFAKDYVTR